MKLSKVKLMDVPDVQKLDRNEQKWILGGYSGSSKCYWESTSGSWDCTDNPLHAYFMGTYYWCCNCSAAASNCK